MTCEPCVFGGDRIPDRRACAELGCPRLTELRMKDLAVREAARWAALSELDREVEPSLSEVGA